MSVLDIIDFNIIFEASARIQTSGATAVASEPVNGSPVQPDEAFLAYGLALAVLRHRGLSYPANVSSPGRALANHLFLMARLNVRDLADEVPA